jgi:acid phosphatase family membrane protein YuiD
VGGSRLLAIAFPVIASLHATFAFTGHQAILVHASYIAPRTMWQVQIRSGTMTASTVGFPSSHVALFLILCQVLSASKL